MDKITASMLLLCGCVLVLAGYEAFRMPDLPVSQPHRNISEVTEGGSFIATGDGHCYERTKQTVEQESKGEIERSEKVIVIKPVECR